jgi:hypothetical protein
MQITLIKALKAMELFLEKYYDENNGDDLGLLLSDISTTIFVDGGTADPAAYEDWLDAILLITGDRSTTILSEQQAFDVMLSYVKAFGLRIKSHEINDLLEEILNNNSPSSENWIFWLKCFQ